MLQIKRIYETPSNEDGYRVLIDRLWPRGVSKAAAKVDLWLKDVAPTSELRKWFAHDPAKFKEFQDRYQSELAHNPSVDAIREANRIYSAVTLLYAAKDPLVNHATVLRDYLKP